MEISLKRYVKIPQTPNFLLVSGHDKSISISELSDEELVKVAEAWTRELLIKAQNKRNQSKGGRE